MAYDTADKTTIMSKANEENGSENGEVDEAEEESVVENKDEEDDNVEESPEEKNEPSTNEVADREPGDSQKTNDSDDVDLSPMSVDTMPLRMEKSPAELAKASTKQEKSKEPQQKSRPETPPLQKLMRQDPLPLFVQKRQHSPPKKSIKESFFPHHKFHIPPMTLSAMSVIKNAPTHPKQTMSKSKMYSNKLLKPYHPFSQSSSYSSAATSPSRKPSSVKSPVDDQPLDLSKKTGGSKSEESAHTSNGHMTSPLSTGSTLQSLQQRFGGNLHMRSLRKPLCGLLPVMPDVLPKPRSPLQNNHSKHPLQHQFSKKPHRSSLNDSPTQHSKSEKGDNSPQRSVHDKDIKEENSSRCDTDMNSNLTLKTDTSDDIDMDNKYTMLKCTCQKTYNSLYSLSIHLQESGHLPAGGKQACLMEYPKLVRGQDMWLNHESEHTKRILRCMQCGESFKSLPMLTVHMMQTQHYTKIVSSEHGRRSHKCSAYCDREMDRECIFKCKVCNSTFTDMEGLANHMILSGHHKKNILRSHNYLNEFAFRGRRKRMFSEEDSPSMTSLLEYKRKCLNHSASSTPVNGRLTDSPEPPEDSTISCENCGERIETNSFVEHVRLCLRSRPSIMGMNLYKDEVNSVKSEKSHDELEELDDASMFDNPIDSEEDVVKSSDVKDEESGKEEQSKSVNKEQKSADSTFSNEVVTNIKIEDNLNRDKDENDRHDVKMEDDIENNNKEKEMESAVRIKSEEISEEKDVEDEGDTLKYPKLTKVLRTDDEKPSISKVSKNLTLENLRERNVDSVKNLDIIDPERSVEHCEETSGNSALQAMESFIQKSFSSKFNYKRGNMVLNSSDRSLLKPSLQPSESRHNSLYRFEKYRKYFQQEEQHNGSMKKISSDEDLKMCIPPSASSSGAKDDLRKLERLCESVKKSQSPKTEIEEHKKNSVFSIERPTSGSSENGEVLASKYLNFDVSDGEPEESKSAGSSALDSLSSFVYGQPLNSEHPLDSLQKLITKSDIPKLLASQSAKYFQHCSSSPEVPLNLSLKKSGEEEGEGEMFSDHEGSESDSDPSIEYRCAACNRHFASKGSYRYHLSRCHLSSVKRYGIKEAFNMSPYVYLPLDHTAKFSKYYEMAHELSSKGK